MSTQTLNRKMIFDAVRSILGRGFRPAEVAVIDAGIDKAKLSRLPVDAPSLAEGPDEVPSRTSSVGIALLHKYEGCARLRDDGMIEAYPDPGTGGRPWTIGWGSTRDGLYGFVRRDTVWTQQECDDRFVDDLKRVYEPQVVRALGDAIDGTSQAQFDALVSFHYNTGAISRATLTMKHKAGDFEGAAREFRRWNKAGGRAMKGLTRRRAAEEKLYRSGM